jgi:hypothetical protein
MNRWIIEKQLLGAGVWSPQWPCKLVWEGHVTKTTSPGSSNTTLFHSWED